MVRVSVALAEKRFFVKLIAPTNPAGAFLRKHNLETFTSNLVISGGTISQDSLGLYSANDLHAASGGKQGSGPKYFLETSRAKRFLGVLEESSEESGKGGNPPFCQTAPGAAGGTFMCKELLIQYASWLSLEVGLAVTRAFIKHPANAHRSLT